MLVERTDNHPGEIRKISEKEYQEMLRTNQWWRKENERLGVEYADALTTIADMQAMWEKEHVEVLDLKAKLKTATEELIEIKAALRNLKRVAHI